MILNRYREIFFASVMVLMLGLAACGSKKSRLEAPNGKAKGPVPLWSAVTKDSSFILHVRLDPLYDIPLVRMGLDMLEEEIITKEGVDYEQLVKEIGFDPLYDMSELLITDIEGGFEKNFVALMRYEEEADLIDSMIKLLSRAMESEKIKSLRKVEIRGRKAVVNEPERFVGIQVDPFTMAVLRGSMEEAEAWLSQMSEKNDNRERIARQLTELAKHEGLGGRPYALALFADFTVMEASPVLHGKVDMSEVKWVSAEAAVERDIFIIGEAEFRDEASAKKKAGELESLFATPPAAISFFGDMLREIQKGISVQQEGSTLKVKAVIPESVLDTIYVLLKMVLDIGKAGQP